MKTVFVAHPISGDVKGNVERVLKICSEIHTKDIVPVAPYLVALQYLNDDVVEERALGIEATLEALHRKFVDELWLYGDRISPGMTEEIKVAQKTGIPIFAKTPQTEQALKEFK